MSFWGKKLILLTFCALVAGAAFGQEWPLPAPTPDAEVTCNTLGCSSSEKGKKLWPYTSPLTKFVGRYADNTTQQWEFVPTGTARTRQIYFAPKNNRIYMILGGLLAAYDMDTFFTRLSGGEAMTPINGLNGIKAGPGREKVLNADRIFYPFQSWNDGFSGGDGERRTYRFDWDDRGNIYIPADAIGWGIVKDDLGKGGGAMTSLYRDGSAANRCMSVKTSDGNYYAYVLYYSDSATSRSQKVLNVNDVTRPEQVSGGVATFSDFAKNADGTRIAVLDNDGIRIYTNDTIARGGAPIATFRTRFGNIASDGTNFFAATLAGSNPVIHVISPDTTGSYTKTAHTLTGVAIDTGITTAVSVFANADSGGYLTLLGYESAYRGYNTRLYKMTNLVPTEVALNGYTAKHYDTAPTGYVDGGKYVDFLEASSVHVVKRGAKYYLIVSAHALGDVYEIKGADFLTAKLKSFGKTINVNSRAAASSGPFYGDEIKFTTDFSGSGLPSVTWNFGDGTVPQTVPGTSPGAPDVTHQYGGLSIAQLPAVMNVTATNSADPSMTHSINLTLAKPTARVGVANTSILFTGATTDLTLPIVSSDFFFDGSDGAVEGHYSEWKLLGDTASTKLAPNQTFSVGALGERELTFTGHYGPYTASFASTASAPLTITPIKYKVRAFAPVVNGPLASAGNVVFKSATRVTANTAHLANGGTTVVAYKWEILNAAGALVGTAVTGNAALAAIPDFTLPRSSFAGAQNWKARLSLTLDNTTETALSTALNGPTPGAIVASGCTNIGSPCSFTVNTSVPGNDPSTWTYSWSAAGVATLPGGTNPSYAPVFALAGNYTITVLVSNALGDAPALTLPVSLGQPLCASNPTTANTGVTCKGRTSGCVAGFSNCSVGETIDFWINTQGWQPSNCDKFVWNWGDGTGNSTAQSPTHVYNSPGTYTVTVSIDGGLNDVSVTKQVTVGNTGGGGNGGGGNGGGGGGGGGGTGACTVLVPPINVFATWTGPTSGCNALTNCSTGEAIAFRMNANGYNYDCAPHSFTYNFGDGTPTQTTFSPTTLVPHTYTTAGPFTLEVLISNGSSSATASHTVKVVVGSGGGGGNGGGGNGGGGGSNTGCSEMNPPTNVYMTYSGPTSGCTSVVGSCAALENINFSLGTQGYNLDCTTHTYEWDFGDGSPKSTQKNATHAYAQGGDYPVSLKINRLDGKTATVSRTVKVTGGNNCPTMVAGQNVILVFFGAKSGCSVAGGNCQEDEVLNFGLIGGYNFGCSTHTVEWDFGDGSPKENGQSPTHTYEKGGEYHGSVKITNSKQSLTVPFDIKIPVIPKKTRSARH